MRAVIILAGGCSSRLGKNKALVPLAGKSLVVRVLDRLRTVGDEFLVSIGKDQLIGDYERALPKDAKVVQDSVNFQCPLAGFLTALAECKSEYCFLVACDMPFVEPKAVEFLFERAKTAAAAVPRWDSGRLEPLHAIYACDTAERTAKQIAAVGRRRMTDLITSIHPVIFVSIETEISLIDPYLQTFTNVNTREDFVVAERDLSRNFRSG